MGNVTIYITRTCVKNEALAKDVLNTLRCVK